VRDMPAERRHRCTAVAAGLLQQRPSALARPCRSAPCARQAYEAVTPMRRGRPEGGLLTTRDPTLLRCPAGARPKRDNPMKRQDQSATVVLGEGSHNETQRLRPAPVGAHLCATSLRSGNAHALRSPTGRTPTTRPTHPSCLHKDTGHRRALSTHPSGSYIS